MAAVALLGLPGLAHAQLGRGEISVGYGVAPVTDWFILLPWSYRNGKNRTHKITGRVIV